MWCRRSSCAMRPRMPVRMASGRQWLAASRPVYGQHPTQRRSAGKAVYSIESRCGGFFSRRQAGTSFAHVASRRMFMLYTLAVILLIAWLLGVVGTYTIGAFVHLLLVIAIVLFIVGLMSGRRTVV